MYLWVVQYVKTLNQLQRNNKVTHPVSLAAWLSWDTEQTRKSLGTLLSGGAGRTGGTLTTLHNQSRLLKFVKKLRD